MNANQILNNNMTLEEKLNAIDKELEAAQAVADEDAKRKGVPSVPIDPSLLTICDGCE